ncbi:hypothetical protein [uncultured Bifidobacterium sp.]|mgnify:FL=1|uniref:hypothetical protein n=1 Tax=uncultured Bifidobacterium sp. TaxID=165187 RepID=UPI002596B59C|nr:hypothetical protein [uncultured Bifidobacterium sp.]
MAEPEKNMRNTFRDTAAKGAGNGDATGLSAASAERYGLCVLALAPAVVAAMRGTAWGAVNFPWYVIGGLVITLAIGVIAVRRPDATVATVMAWDLLGSAAGVLVVCWPRLRTAFNRPVVQMLLDNPLLPITLVVIAFIVRALLRWLLVRSKVRQAASGTGTTSQQATESQNGKTSAPAGGKNPTLLDVIGRRGGGIMWYAVGCALPVCVAYLALSLLVQGAYGTPVWIAALPMMLLRMAAVLLVSVLCMFLQLAQGRTSFGPITTVMHVLFLACIALPLLFPMMGSGPLISTDADMMQGLGTDVLTVPVLVAMTALVAAWVVVSAVLRWSEAKRLFGMGQVAVVAVAGLAWVVKTAVMFPFAGSLLAVVVYLCVAMIIMARSLGRERGFVAVSKPFTAGVLSLTCMAVAVAAVCATVIAVEYGYALSAAVAAVGCVVVWAIVRAKPTVGSRLWAVKGMRRTVAVVAIAAVAWTIAEHRGYGRGIVPLMVAAVVVAIAMIWAMLFRNDVGIDGSVPYRIAAAVFFILFTAAMLLLSIHGTVVV